MEEPAVNTVPSPTKGTEEKKRRRGLLPLLLLLLFLLLATSCIVGFLLGRSTEPGRFGALIDTIVLSPERADPAPLPMKGEESPGAPSGHTREPELPAAETAGQRPKETAAPTQSPTIEPGETPDVVETAAPGMVPTVEPTAVPVTSPSAAPVVTSTAKPAETPSATPSAKPSVKPTASPKPSRRPRGDRDDDHSGGSGPAPTPTPDVTGRTEVYHGDTGEAWTQQASIDLFRPLDGSSERRIAPGSKGYYLFKLKNGRSGKVQFTLAIRESGFHVPLKYRITDSETRGELSGWQTAAPETETVSGALVLEGGTEGTYRIEWQWPFDGDDRTDTALGREGGTYTLKLTIRAEDVV